MTTEIERLPIDQIRTLPFDQLRTLHREIGQLIAERRNSELQDLKQRAAVLGFSAADFAPPAKHSKTNGHLPPKFGDGMTEETSSVSGPLHAAFCLPRGSENPFETNV